MTPFIVRDVDTGREVALNPYHVVAIEPSTEGIETPETFITYGDPALTLNVEGSWSEIVNAFEAALSETRRENNDNRARAGF